MVQGEGPILMADLRLPVGSKTLGSVLTGHGNVVVWRLSEDAGRLSDLTAAYVGVVEGATETYLGPPVAMLVTVYDPDVSPGRAAELRDTPGRRTPGRWYGDARQIDNVFAYDEFRGGTPQGLTAASAVGRLLHSQGCFERHSEIRSHSGDRWAEAVGGEVPPLLKRPTGDLETHMRAWLDDFNDVVSEADVG
jgi:hypothetical protein